MTTAAVRAVVLLRAGAACERCHRPLGFDYSLHHRRPRGMGGTRRPSTELPSNFLALCGSGTTGCHGWVESNRTRARELGLLVRQHANPATTPVVLRRGRVLLTDDGRYAQEAA